MEGSMTSRTGPPSSPEGADGEASARSSAGTAIGAHMYLCGENKSSRMRWSVYLLGDQQVRRNRQTKPSANLSVASLAVGRPTFSPPPGCPGPMQPVAVGLLNRLGCEALGGSNPPLSAPALHDEDMPDLRDRVVGARLYLTLQSGPTS